MKKTNWLRAFGSVLGASVMTATGSALAETPSTLLDRLEGYQGSSSMNQVNSVTEFSDVSPRHWAYGALQSLVERYNCIEGFPDGTFRGDSTLTRYEFAAALNACLIAVENIASTGGGGDVSSEDLRQLYVLAEEFQGELQVLGGRVDGLEARVDTIESQQFSTTTKLEGEAIFQFDTAFADDPILGRDNPGGFDTQEQSTIGYRVRLNFDTSFTGKDRLRTRLQSDNLQFLESTTGTASTSLNYFPIGTGSNIVIGELSYSFPAFDDRVTFVVAADGLLVDDLFNLGPTAGYAYDALNLTVAYNNLIYDVSNADGAGFGANILLSDSVQLDIGYFLQRGIGNDPSKGIFNSSFSTGAHLNYDVTEKFSASLAYIYNFFEEGTPFDVSGFVGTDNAQQPFGDVNTNSHNLGFQFNYAVSPKFGFGGYVGYAFASALDSSDDSADLLTAQLNVHFPDLGKEGDTLLIAAAIAPTVISADGVLDDDEVAESLGSDGSLPIVIEVSYRYPFTDNIITTFGGVGVINPEGISDNDTIFVGTIRTQFLF